MCPLCYRNQLTECWERILIMLLCVSFYDFQGTVSATGYWIHDLIYSKNVLYHWETPPAPPFESTLIYFRPFNLFKSCTKKNASAFFRWESTVWQRFESLAPDFTASSGRDKFIPDLFFHTQNSQLYLGSENKESFYANVIYIETGFIPQHMPYLERMFAKNKCPWINQFNHFALKYI